jgi:hypothetical protein
MAWTTNKGEVDIMLRFSLDEAAQKRVEQGISSVNQELKKIADVVANEQAEKAASEARLARFKREETAATRVQSSWRRMQFTARALGEVSQIVAIASSAIFVGASAWAAKYVKDAKASTDTIQGWRVALDGINTSQTRVGAVLATVLLPLLKTAQDLAEKGADFVEANPKLIQVGLNIAGVVAGIATIGLAASKGFKIYADIGYTLATAKQVTAAGIYQAAAAMSLEAANIEMAAATTKVTGALPAAAVEVAAGAGGAGVGLAGGAAAGGLLYTVLAGVSALVPPLILLAAELAIAKARGQDLWVSFKQMGTIAMATAAGGIVGLWNGITKGTNILDEAAVATDNWIVKIGRWLGVVNEEPKAPPPVAGSGEYMDVFVKNNVRMFIDYQKQIADATKEYGKRMVDLEVSYEKQRTDAVATYAKQRAEAESSYQLDTSRSMRDFALSEAQAEEDYYQSRADAATSYGEDARRSEEDHLREMRRLLEDHNDKVEGFAATRDALGYAREMRDYERKRRDAEEEYLSEQGRRNRDFALRMRDLETQFRKERARRLQQFNQTMKDNAADHAAQMSQMAADQTDKLTRLKEDYDAQVAVLKTSYEEQIKTLEDSFLLRIHDLDATIVGDYAVFQTTTAAMAIRFRAWLAALSQSVGSNINYGTPGPHAGGGYVNLPGPTENGYEYLLSHPSTRLAERLVGGNLTQSRLMAALAGGGSRYSDNRTMQFNGMTASDRDWVRSLVVRVAEQTVVDATRR